jgi:hypothetical protein
MTENIDKMNPENTEFVNTLRGDDDDKEEDSLDKLSPGPRKETAGVRTDLSDDMSVYDQVLVKPPSSHQPYSSGVVAADQGVNKERRRRHRWLSSSMHPSSSLLQHRHKFNIEIMQRLIGILGLESDQLAFDGESQIRSYLLAESKANNHGAHSQSTSSSRAGKRPRTGFYDTLFTWTASMSSASDRHQLRGPHQQHQQHPMVGRYIRYRRALSSICDDHHHHRSTGSSKRKKARQLSHHHQHQQQQPSVQITSTSDSASVSRGVSKTRSTPEASTSSKYLGLEVIASKSFWMYAIGMRPHLLSNKPVAEPPSQPQPQPGTQSAVVGTVAARELMAPADIEQDEGKGESDRGYSSEDELSCDYLSYDEQDQISASKRARSSKNHLVDKGNEYLSRRISASFADTVDSITNDWFSMNLATSLATTTAPAASELSPPRPHGSGIDAKAMSPSLKHILDSDLLLPPAIKRKRKAREKRYASTSAAIRHSCYALKSFYDGTIDSAADIDGSHTKEYSFSMYAATGSGIDEEDGRAIKTASAYRIRMHRITRKAHKKNASQP